jgi:hypothetical protein
MTEQEFIEIVSLNVETWFTEDQKKKRWHWREHNYVKRSGKNLKDINLDDVIMTHWSSGGVSGGSCWDDGSNDPHYPVSGDDEPELVELDIILDVVCPQMTRKEYKQLLNGVQPELVQYEEWSVSEYYGNYTDYRLKQVSLRRLYERLTAMGLL